jgi:hypothetical protein
MKKDHRIYKTTERDFALFKAAFTEWQKKLGLTEWKVCFEKIHLDDSYGWCWAHADGRIATVSMCDRLDITKGELLGWDPAETGRHEALELLMSSMEIVAGQRFIRPDDIVQARHAVIRRLEAVFDEMKV